MGRPRKNPVLTEETKAVLEETAKGTMVELPVDDIRQISVTTRAKVSLASPQYDPFKKYKTDEKRFYYRALNNRAHNLRKREAEGYTTIPEAQYGDLILGKMPRDLREEREEVAKEKSKNQALAASEQFKETAERAGVKSYDEK